MRRAVHTAIIACLVAQRLVWEPETLSKVFKIALTMNMSMLAMQGQLARQRSPLKFDLAMAPHRPRCLKIATT